MFHKLLCFCILKRVSEILCNLTEKAEWNNIALVYWNHYAKMLHFICLSTDVESDVVLTIPAHKYVGSWNLRSQHARFCGTIINNDKKCIYTEWDKPAVKVIHLVYHRASCLLHILIWACCIWAKCCVFKGPELFFHGPSMTWPGSSGTPTQAPSSHCSGISVKLSRGTWAVIDVPVFSFGFCQSWLDDLISGMICPLSFVWWWLGY